MALMVCYGAGCRAERPPQPAASAPAPVVDSPPQPAPAVVSDAAPALPPASESAARALLDRRFRAAGFRIVNDVRVVTSTAALTCDGYDPARKVGFEYIAAAERGTDVSRAEIAALAAQRTYRLLVVQAAPLAAVDAAAQRFLHALKTPNSGSGRR